jgi:hypothetical protein
MNKDEAIKEATRVMQNFRQFCSDIGITPFYYGLVMGIAMSRYRPHLVRLIRRAGKHKVFFIGRDMDAIYFALRSNGIGRRASYLRGCNRYNTRRLNKENKLKQFVMNQGVRRGDVLIDSGFYGTLPKQINEALPIEAYLLTANDGPAYPAVNEKLNQPVHRDVVCRFEHAPKYEITYWDGGTPSGEWGEIEGGFANYDPCVPELEQDYYQYRDGFVVGFNQHWNQAQIKLCQDQILYWPDFEAYAEPEKYKAQPQVTKGPVDRLRDLMDQLEGNAYLYWKDEPRVLAEAIEVAKCIGEEAQVQKYIDSAKGREFKLIEELKVSLNPDAIACNCEGCQKGREETLKRLNDLEKKYGLVAGDFGLYRSPVLAGNLLRITGPGMGPF